MMKNGAFGKGQVAYAGSRWQSRRVVIRHSPFAIYNLANCTKCTATGLTILWYHMHAKFPTANRGCVSNFPAPPSAPSQSGPANRPMTNNISILLIENQICVVADVVKALAHHVESFRLTMATTLTEVIEDRPPADAVLVGLSQLAQDPGGQLTLVAEQYPQSLLVVLAAPDSINDDRLAQALQAGTAEFVPLSKAGLLSLGRRLAVATHPAAPALPETLAEIFDSGLAPAAIQIIDADNRIKYWNQTAEQLFGLPAAETVGRQVDQISLNPVDLSRLKDMIDQARTGKEPFRVRQYSPENRAASSILQAHVYPVSNGQAVNDVCIVTVEMTQPPDTSKEDLHLKQELQMLLEASRAITGQLALKPTLEKVLEQIKLALYGDNCQIYFLEKDNQTLRPVLAVGPLADQISRTPIPVSDEAINRVISRGEVHVFAAPPFQGINYPPDEQVLCAPLTAARGVIGLMVVSRRKLSFDEGDLRFFESLVHQASSAINNARLFEETQRNLLELEILYAASTAISSHWDDQDVLNMLIQKIVSAMNVSLGFIASWDKTNNKGYIHAVSRADGPPAELSPVIDLNTRQFMQKMLRQQRPLFLHLSTPYLDDTERHEMERYQARSRLLVPLVAKAETIGWMELWETRAERIFSADEVRLSRTLASQIAVALQNATYFKQVQQTLDESTALYRVSSALTTLQDPQAIMSTVLQESLQALHLTQGSIVQFDFATRQGVVKVHLHDTNPQRPSPNEENPAKPYKVFEGQQIPLSGNPVYEKLMRTRRSVVIDDPTAEWLTASSFAREQVIPPAGGWGDEQAFAILVTPIIIREEIVGVMVIENTRHLQSFNNWAVSMSRAMADQLAIGLQNVQLFEAEYRRREQAETLREVASIVSSSLKLDDVLERVLDQLGRVVKYDSAAIHLIEGKVRRVIAGRGFPQQDQHIGLTFPIKPDENEPGSIVIHTRQPAVHSNISESYADFRGELHKHIKSWMGVPLIARDKIIGLISIDHSEADAYSEEDVQMTLAFANQVAVTLENARLYELEVRELERELKIAHQIQETLLPQATPTVPGLDIAGRIIPARQVGGDFFHFFSTGADHLGVAIGDVSGKGIPAALYMAAGITAIDIQVGPNILPGELLNRLNQKLYTRLHENKMNIALQIATFVPFSRQNHRQFKHPFEAKATLMTVASAGMIAPIGATQHGCRLLPVGALPVGAMPGPPQFYTDDVFFIEPSTAIIFTSDGIVEAQNEYGELFGFERLEETILEIIETANAELIVDHIIASVKRFAGDVEQHDDMTVVVVTKR